MVKHMAPHAAALVYVLRHPPKGLGTKKLQFKQIPREIEKAGFARPTPWQVKWQAKNFGKQALPRGRKHGWRKTTAAEDKEVLATFHKVRQPMGSAVDSRDVFNALPDALRQKICLRTVRERLREKGFAMSEKKAVDDKGDAWRKQRVVWCQARQQWTEERCRRQVQGVADFKEYTFYTKNLKSRFKVKSCHRTIMSQGERKKAAFQRPKKGKIFERREYKKGSRKCKVFGLTTSTGEVLVLPSKKLHPTSEDWMKMVPRVYDFLRSCFPARAAYTLLLDGETILRTPEALDVMKKHGIRISPNWPAHSPDLNPQENMWGWVEPKLRKEEKKTDTFAVFKRRVLAVCKKYPAPEKLVPGLAQRIATCLALGRAHLGK